MSDLNDALVQQIIRSSLDASPARRAAFQSSLHPLANGSLGPVPAVSAVIARVVAGMRADLGRIADRVAPQPTVDPACCPAVA